jgi:hypothetical protein
MTTVIDINDSISIQSENACSICWTSMKKSYKTKCNHLFHKICIDKWLENNTTCPLCREVIKKIKINSVLPNNHNTQNNIRGSQNQQHEQNDHFEFVNNKKYSCTLLLLYIIFTLYNLIILYISNNHIDYNSNTLVIILLVTIFIMCFNIYGVIKELHTNCMFFFILLLHITSLILYITNNKNLILHFDMFSVKYRINIILSFVLYILITTMILVTSCIVSCNKNR